MAAAITAVMAAAIMAATEAMVAATRYGPYGSYTNNIGYPYYGWYDNYYYPGTGSYVYDSYRRPHVWSNSQQQYWTSRRAQAVNRDRAQSVNNDRTRTQATVKRPFARTGAASIAATPPSATIEAPCVAIAPIPDRNAATASGRASQPAADGSGRSM